MAPLVDYLHKSAYPQETEDDMVKLRDSFDSHAPYVRDLDAERERLVEMVDTFKDKLYVAEDELKARLLAES